MFMGIQRCVRSAGQVKRSVARAVGSMHDHWPTGRKISGMILSFSIHYLDSIRTTGSLGMHTVQHDTRQWLGDEL
jgi:hypothetical protein